MANIVRRRNIVTGRRYSTAQGEEKTRWTTIGKIFQDDQGHEYIKLDVVPLDWDGFASIFEEQQPQRAPQPQQPYQQPYQQQYQQYGMPGDVKPNNYLVWSILSIVLCCWPIGIAAVVYAAKVDSLWGQGRHDESRAASEKAKNLTIVSAICGAVIYTIYGILIATGSL